VIDGAWHEKSAHECDCVTEAYEEEQVGADAVGDDEDAFGHDIIVGLPGGAVMRHVPQDFRPAVR
jgi:hypothetical protein